MARIAERLGVEIALDQPVEEILFEGRRAVGVRTREGVFRAAALIVNADFARAMSQLVPDRLRRCWTDRKIARKKFSCSTFMMYLGVEGTFDLPHHNIHIAADYALNLDEIENQHVLSGDPSFYVQNAGVTDPTLAPRGMSTLYGTHPGSGLPVIFESARISTRLLLGDLGVEHSRKPLSELQLAAMNLEPLS
jgi:phytoene desaturase